MFTNFLCNSFILSLLVLSAHCPHCITRGWCARLGCSMTTETRRETDSGPEPRPRWLRLRHGVLNMSYITDMKQNDWQVITQPRWMTQTLNFDVYCKAAWRMIWRLRGCEVCQNYYPSFLSKILLRRAVSSLSLLWNASKKLKQNLVTSLTFDFNFIMFEQARHLYSTNYSSPLSFLLSGFKVMSDTAISCWLLLTKFDGNMKVLSVLRVEAAGRSPRSPGSLWTWWGWGYWHNTQRGEDYTDWLPYDDEHTRSQLHHNTGMNMKIFLLLYY